MGPTALKETEMNQAEPEKKEPEPPVVFIGSIFDFLAMIEAMQPSYYERLRDGYWVN
jgi:hypothetical protein